MNSSCGGGHLLSPIIERINKRPEVISELVKVLGREGVIDSGKIILSCPSCKQDYVTITCTVNAHNGAADIKWKCGHCKIENRLFDNLLGLVALLKGTKPNTWLYAKELYDILFFNVEPCADIYTAGKWKGQPLDKVPASELEFRVYGKPDLELAAPLKEKCRERLTPNCTAIESIRAYAKEHKSAQPAKTSSPLKEKEKATLYVPPVAVEKETANATTISRPSFEQWKEQRAKVNKEEK